MSVWLYKSAAKPLPTKNVKKNNQSFQMMSWLKLFLKGNFAPKNTYDQVFRSQMTLLDVLTKGQ